jgi:hypothetical protein
MGDLAPKIALIGDFRCATPYIPFKTSTVVPEESLSMWARMYHLFMFNRDVYLEHFHKRSNVESTFSMAKGKFGAAVKSKSDVGQGNEVLAKVLWHNVCVLVQAMHELGIEPAFNIWLPAAKSRFSRRGRRLRR